MLSIFKKRNHSLIISIIFLLLITTNDAYALGEAKKVVNGTITMYSDKIVYKYKEIGGEEVNNIKITNDDNQPIQTSRETSRVLFAGSENKSLSFDYFAGNSQITVGDILNEVENGILITGQSSGIEIVYTPLIMNLTQKDSVFAIMGTILTDEKSLKTVLFENNGITDINTTNILFVGNEASVKSDYLSLFYNKNNLNLKSEFFIVENNVFYSESNDNSVSLFHNNSNFRLDSNFVSISYNDIESINKEAILFYNEIGSVTFGTANTKKLIISNNDVKSKKYSSVSLFFNDDVLGLNGNSITITNNFITPSMGLKDGNNKVLCSPVFYNKGEMNINLYGTNPSFVLTDNHILMYPYNPNLLSKYNLDVIGIILMNKSQLNFINNSNTRAIIRIGHDIRSIYVDDSNNHYTDNKDIGSIIVFENNEYEKNKNIRSIITFKNGEYEKDSRKITYSGSIELDIGPNIMEANIFNIEAKTIFLLAANNEEMMSRLVGKGGTNNDIETLPKLNITKDGKLIITVDWKNPENIVINKPYTIISGFVITEDIKNRIILNKNLDAVIDYIDDENNSSIKTVTILFKSFEFKVEEEIKNNYNYNAIYDMFKKNYEKKHEYKRNYETTEKILQFFFNDPEGNNTTDDKISLIKDILPTEPSDIVAITSSLVLRPINSVIVNRLVTTNSIKLRGDNSVTTNSDSNEKVNNNNSENNLKIWFNTNYNFSYNYNNKNSINFISTIIGIEYNYGSKNNLFGLVYRPTSVYDNNNYRAEVISLYYNIGLDKKSTNFIGIITNFGSLNVKEVRNSNKDNIAITYNYDINVSSLTCIFGHNIKLANSDVLTPRIMVEYSSIDRYIPYDGESSNIDFKISELSLKILTPIVGIDYQTFINKAKTLTFRTSINFRYDVNLTKETDVDISLIEYQRKHISVDYDNHESFITNDTNKKTLKYDSSSINNFNTELSFDLSYYNPTKSNLKFSIGGYMGFSTNGYVNIGVNLEGRWKVK